MYKSFFIPSDRTVPKKKMELYSQYIVDGVALQSKVQALLYEYEKQGYVFVSMEGIQSTQGTFTYTEGLVVILSKEI